jgi:hypothetical protein
MSDDGSNAVNFTDITAVALLLVAFANNRQQLVVHLGLLLAKAGCHYDVG